MNRRGAFPALAAAALLAGCTRYTPPPAPTLAALEGRGDVGAAVTVYLVYDAFHAGLAMPADVLRRDHGATAEALSRLPPMRWVYFGFGDARFYQQQGSGPARWLDLVRSMLKPGNPSVVQLRALADPLRDPKHPHVLRILIAGGRVEAMLARIDASFAGGRPQFVAEGLGGRGDQFFRGARPASAIHECNQWIGDVLGAAGVPHTPLIDTTAPGLAWDLQRRGYAARPG